MYVDPVGQVVTSSNLDGFTIALSRSSSSYTPNYNAQEASPWSTSGVFNLTDITFSGEPGTQVTLILTSSFIDSSLALVKPNYFLKGTISFRECVSGEEFTSDGQCIECSPGFYLIQPPSSPTSCLTCPSNAHCFGGNKVSPKPGYWRSSESSLQFLRCYTPSACTGSSQGDFNPQGHCYSGYQGILCAQCETGYSRNSNFQCAACPEMWKNALLLLGILLLSTAFLVIFIRVTLASTLAKKSNISVYLKILTNHLQLIVITLNFDLDWPNEVNAVNESAQPLADVSSQLISFDCFLG